ncbi:LamG-like jellyroll fold domain-containing protein [Verrucomicrobium spinosum]|uniref:LamG-like jellyroll fold domain-containing protein n=1 Tax=Verrucomicrobium spinosum TaxID=2736 RepID=UPI0009463952|nr:LamG-like jellyroll fold domain-containing protein [Verrucomicrobium spinosum]
MSNLEEYEAGTNPDTPDSDEDSLRDNLAVGKLAGYWKMDVEGPAGHEIADSTPSNADGTAHQQARIESESGIAGTAALQLGLQNESRVTLPPDLFEWQPDTTLAFWMKSSTQGEMSVLSAPSATNDNAYLVLLKDRFLRLYTGLHSNDYVEWEPALTDGQWHHVVVVRQGSANKASLYVDGVSFGERSGTFVTQDIDLVVLGHEADSVNGDFVPSQRFRGFLDEVRFYQRAVTSAEAKSLALWQPRLQNQDDLDHDGMADAWELAHQVTDPQADHDGDGRTNVQEFLSNSDPWDYYNGRPPVLTDVFNPSGGTDLLMRLGIRDPGAADDDSWRAYINGTYIGRNLPTGSSSSDFNYSNILYLPIGLTGTFTFQIIYDGNEDGSSFQLDLQFLNSIPYTLTGYSTLPQGSGYQFTIDVSDDFDNDGLMNAVEVIMTTDPWDPDTDDDGLPDGWEISYDLNPKDATGIHGGGADADDDGLTNLQEYEAHTSPRTFDSDGDLLPDGWELAYGGVFSPLVANDRFGDEDGDGLTNLDEKIFQTDPLVADTDGDGTSDGDEVSQAGLPNDVGDFGLPPSFPANRAQPNPGDAWALKLEVGDPTGGHSERYTLVVRDAETGAVLLEHEGGTFGQPSAREYSQFRHGKNYTFQLKWNGSAPILNLAQPDFDGVASVKLVGLPAAMDWTSLGYRLIDSIDTTTWSPTASPQVFTTWNDKFSFKADAAKHETVLIWLSDQQTDSDGDGLVDSEERHIYGTNPALADTDVDGIPDGWEVRNGQNPLVKDADADPDDDHLTNLSEWQHGSDPRLTDTDEDGLPDGWEVSNGTNPANAKDRLEDKDGDRVPNYVEFLKGTLPNDNQSLPAPDVVVDSQLASASSSDNIFATLQEAYSALPSPSGEPAFSVIRVVPGKYAGLDGHLQKKQVVWLADETGSVEVTGSFAGFWLAADTVVSGFQFQGLGVNVASTGVLISGSQSSGGSAPDVRLINCFFRNHHCGTIDNTAAGRRFAGGVINEGGEVHVLHCTFWNNTGTDADAVVNRSGTVQIVNSVIWNPGQSSGANQAIWEAVLGQNVKVIDSLIQGSTENESIEDPGLTLAGNITADSLAKDMGTVSAGVLRDIYGTVRPQGAGYDLGAEEWLDTDGDNLPDWWESRYGFDPQASTDQNDTDNDGAGRLAEFMAGSDPTDFFSKPGASLPVLEIVGGNNQRLDAGQVTPQPLEVCVRDQVTNELLVAAPIDFTIVTGGGVLYETAGGQPIESTPVRLQTDSEGKARIYYKQPASPQYRSTIRASAGTSATVEFSLFDTAFTVQPDSITATISAGTSENSELTLSNQTSEPVAYNLEVENGAALFSSGDDYQWKKTGDDGGPAYQWTDISTTGSRLATVSDGDDVSQEVSLAFSFPFYDGHFETVFVHSNGYLTFGAAATQTAPDSIPGLSLPPNLVAGLFVDMDGATSGDVYCFSDSEKCIIQYQDAKFQWWDGKATFQIVLHKGGRIELIYKELTGDFAYSLTGIQNGMKSKGVEVSYFTYVLQSEMAVVLHREHQWLSVAAPVGQLGVGESVSIPITLNASKLESGSFEGVVLVGNDLASGAVEVPVMMTVDSLPTVSITQPSADFVHNPGSSVQLAAQANDMEGPISKVEFYIDGLRIAEDATAPYETTWWPNLSAGDHELVVKAYDTQGGVGVSVPRIVGAVQESRLSLRLLAGTARLGSLRRFCPRPLF